MEHSHKEVRVNFFMEGTEFKYLVRYYINGNLWNWEEFIGSNEVGKAVADFYHGKSKP